MDLHAPEYSLPPPPPLQGAYTTAEYSYGYDQAGAGGAHSSYGYDQVGAVGADNSYGYDQAGAAGVDNCNFYGYEQAGAGGAGYYDQVTAAGAGGGYGQYDEYQYDRYGGAWQMLLATLSNAYQTLVS